VTDRPRKLCLIASASGNGKTTLGRTAATRLGVPFVELDALVHGPNWTETPDSILQAQLEPVLAGDGWVIDNAYARKLGDLVLSRAEQVVWLDLPITVWMPRLIRRTTRRVITREELWNGNRESLRSTVWGRESLFGYALGSHFSRRRAWPGALARYPVVRLRSVSEVAAWLEALH
jgi:adenylate kinase family enzyme